MRDLMTKNKSFLEISNTLSKKGVKNYDFILELNDSTLQGVDPYSEDLTDEEKVKIYLECVKNPWYFIREVVRIPVGGFTPGIRYVANLGNISSTYLKLNNINQILSLPRQHGKLYTHIVIDLWYMYFGSFNLHNVYFAKKFNYSKSNMKQISIFRDLLPDYLLSIIIHEKDKDRIEYKYSHLFNNSIKAMSAPTTKEHSEKLGCGITSSMVLLDDFSYIKFNKNVYEAIRPAWSAASVNAEKNNVPYSINILINGGKLNTDEGKYSYGLVLGSMPFDLSMFDMEPDVIKENIKTHMREASIYDKVNDFVYINFTWKELGKNQEWYDHNCKIFMNDKEKISRELDCEWSDINEELENNQRIV